jgi:hypothetical protein
MPSKDWKIPNMVLVFPGERGKEPNRQVIHTDAPGVFTFSGG